MTARDELADILISDALNETAYVGRDYALAEADAILTAGYRKPRTISTVEELDALPVGSIIHMTRIRTPFLRTAAGWESTRTPGKPVYDYLRPAEYFPATVLFEPVVAK